MSRKNTEFPDDKTERERRRDLSDEQIEELERAGGVEGGMVAGNAAGTSDPEAKANGPSDRLKH